jgi:ribosomal-protein-alanine N-acetyltransferase
MSALPRSAPQLAAMVTSDLDEVLLIEQQAYSAPWSRGNFVDSLVAGYEAHVLRGPGAELWAYFLAMPGVDEMHLLNLTVAPSQQGRGLARLMLDTLLDICRRRGASQLWLEVRVSNARARRLYGLYGFAEVGLRRAYYPAEQGKREDAVLMSLGVPP